MSDTPQGPGWWQASDDKWYPPPRPQMPGEETAPATTVAPTTTPYGAPAEPTAPTAPTAVSSGGFPAGPPTAVSGPGFAPPGAPGPGTPVPGAPGPGGPGGPPSMPGAPPSPYGMPPVVTPPGGQNRTPLFIVLGVLVAAAIVGVILAVTSGGDDGDTADPGTTTTVGPATTAAPGTTATPETTEGGGSGGGGGGGGGGGQASTDIEVIEQGFSVYTDQLSEEQRLSYGFVLQNNGDQVASGLPVTVAFLDDGGTVVGNADQTIGVLLPGQKMGIGDEPYDVPAGAATMEVTVGEPSSWESPDGYGEITAEGITTSLDDYGAPTSTFTATSTYGEQIDSPNAFALYRNGAGDIVGGSYGFLNFVPANGSTAGDVTSFSSIPNIDGSKTEIYIDPGYIF